jgi:hypothetical protein
MSTDTGQTTGEAGAGKVAAGRFPGHLYAGALRQLVGWARSNDRRRCPQLPCPGSWLARLVALSADGWLASFDGACPQRSDHFIGGGFGHLDQREPISDLDRADVAATEPRLASNGPDQILGSHPGGASGPHEQARAPIGCCAAPSPVASNDRTPPLRFAVLPQPSLWNLRPRQRRLPSPRGPA